MLFITINYLSVPEISVFFLFNETRLNGINIFTNSHTFKKKGTEWGQNTISNAWSKPPHSACQASQRDLDRTQK
jgi:hypothetical protein